MMKKQEIIETILLSCIGFFLVCFIYIGLYKIGILQ